MQGNFVSVNDAADILGCTTGRVRQLIGEGVIEAEKLNAHAWAVYRKSVDKLSKIPRSTGRPRKNEARMAS